MEHLHSQHFCCILLLTFIQNKHCYFGEKFIFNKKGRMHKKGSSNFSLHSITKVQLQFASEFIVYLKLRGLGSVGHVSRWLIDSCDRVVVANRRSGVISGFSSFLRQSSSQNFNSCFQKRVFKVI